MWVNILYMDPLGIILYIQMISISLPSLVPVVPLVPLGSERVHGQSPCAGRTRGLLRARGPSASLGPRKQADGALKKPGGGKEVCHGTLLARFFVYIWMNFDDSEIVFLVLRYVWY